MCIHRCVDTIEFFLSRHRLVLAAFPRCLTCAKQAAGVTSSNSTTTQVTATGNNHSKANVNGGVNAVEAGDPDSVVDNAVELDVDLSDDEDDDMPNNDVATYFESSTSKNRGGATMAKGQDQTSHLSCR